jgi:hypothetical protein
VQLRVPIGWRRAGEGADRISFTNGLPIGFRSTATLWVGPEGRGPGCRRASCSCDELPALVRGLVEADLFRLLDAGSFVRLTLNNRQPGATLGGSPASHVEGTLVAADGAARLTAVCGTPPALGGAPVAVIALEPDERGKLARRIAEGLELPPPDDPPLGASAATVGPLQDLSAQSTQPPSAERSFVR